MNNEIQRFVFPSQGNVYSRYLVILLHIGFVLTGVVTTLLGPIIPVLSVKWSLNDSQAGFLFTAQFVGSMLGVAGSRRFISRWGFLGSLVVGFSLMAAGVAGGAVGGRAIGFISVFSYGIGLGITIPTTNLLVVELNPTRRAAAVNLLNFAWGLGAVTSPPFVALLVRHSDVFKPLLGLSAFLAMIAMGIMWFPKINSVTGPGPVDAISAAAHQVLFNPSVFLIGALVFLYVGTENAIAGWVASYALRLTEQPHPLWVLAPSIFWAALLLGRLTAPYTLRHVDEENLVLIGLATATLGGVLIFMELNLGGLLAGVGFAGAGLATVFPTTIAMLPRCFGGAAQKIASLIFLIAGLGGATLPWVVGFLSTRFGNLRVGLLVPLFASLAMILLQVAIISTLSRRKPNLAS